MPMHDWTRVDASIFHSFLHGWISEIKRALDCELPNSCYAMVERADAGGFGSDFVAIEEGCVSPAGVAIQTKPQTTHYAMRPTEFCRRKKNSVAIRHVSGDRIVAMIEIVSPGNKNSERPWNAFLHKAWELLEHRIHLLLIDPFPPGKHDPNGIHAAIWSTDEDEPFVLPPTRPLTLVAYECSLITEAYIETLAVGEPLPDMPVFLEPEFHVMVPLEATYRAAWDTVPARWQRVIAAESV